MRHASLLSFVAFVGAASAQVLTIPDNLNTFSAGPSTGVWRTAAGTVQFIYDASHFTNAGVTGPITINRLRFRGADGQTLPGGHFWAGATVTLGGAAVDYVAMVTGYAGNRGAMGLTGVITPGITHLPISGNWTNDTLVDIDLTATIPPSSFTYDPTLGADFLIEITFPVAPIPATNIASAACGSNAFTHRGKRNVGTILGPGVVNDFVPVVKLDFTGPGGYTNPSGAWAEKIGAACGSQAQSYYQAFDFIGDTFDLQGPGRSILMTPDSPTSPTFYIVTAGATAVDLSANAIGGTPNITDDGVVAHTPGFTVRFPGGSTTVLNACANGYVWLGSNTLGDFSPSVLKFLNSTPRLAICWFDQHAGRNTVTHPGSGMYTFTDTSGGVGNYVTYITWKETGMFNVANAQGGAAVQTYQIVITENTGTVEYRYGAMSGLRGGVAGIVGFSRGGTTTVPAKDPGSRDLSVEMGSGFTTQGADTQSALTLTESIRPYLSVTGVPASAVHTLANIPVTTAIAAVVIDFAPAFQPGVPLPLGSAGCIQTVINPVILALQVSNATPFVTPGFVLPLGISPTAGGWMGAQLITQGVTLDNNVTTLSSNALKLIMGLL